MIFTSLSTKIIGSSCMLIGMVVFWHWEAMLISHLSTRLIQWPFKHMHELLTKTDYRVLVTVGTSLEDFFKLSRDPIIQDVWSNRIQPYIDEPAWIGHSISNKMESVVKGHNLAFFFNEFIGKYVNFIVIISLLHD